MAKIQCEVFGDFDLILNSVSNAVTDGSMSATLEDSSDFYGTDSRCAVRVYERYSYLGKNRVSLSITLFQTHEHIYITAITSGGSEAMFFKINTFGEKSFLNTVRNTIEAFTYRGYYG
ncbi:MAG: hypothetical protein IK990_11915 [Ruminiclostridium sp.]|nr:hypothetical protein [Ruminiclostridium sp.]